MKIAIPKYDINIGSQRIPFFVYKNLLEKYYSVEFVGYDEIKDSNIVFVYSGFKNINTLIAKNKKAKFIMFKPHLEIPIACSDTSLIKRLLTFIFYFFKIRFNNEKKFKSKIIVLLTFWFVIPLEFQGFLVLEDTKLYIVLW